MIDINRPVLTLLLVGLGCEIAGTLHAETEWRAHLALRADRFARSDPRTIGWLDGDLSWQGSGDNWTGFMALNLWGDTDGITARGDDRFAGSDRGQQRAPLQLREAWLRHRRGRWTLQLGRFPVAWGVTDTVRPADVVMGYDWSDPLTERRELPWGARLLWRTAQDELEFLLLGPRDLSRLPRGRFALGSGIPLRIESPARQWDEVGFAAHWQHRTDRVETALYFFSGTDDAPRLELAVPPAVAAPTLRGRAVAQRTVAAALWGQLGPLVARVEAAWNQAHDEADYGLIAGELERSWGDWHLIVGYADSVSDRRRTVSGLDSGFLPALLVHLERGELTGARGSFEWVEGTNADQRLIRIEGSWPVGQRTRVTARLELLSGDPTTLLGGWRQQDRVALQTTWDW